MNINNKQKREPLHIVSAVHPTGGYVARPGEHHIVRLKRTREGGYIAMPSSAARQRRGKEAHTIGKLLSA